MVLSLTGRARAGEAVRRSETFIVSYRTLPPGHDPGAGCGEAPDGRQRGSRPLDILVECRGHAGPRREYVYVPTFAAMTAVTTRTVASSHGTVRTTSVS